jgi:hypothetical protein
MSASWRDPDFRYIPAAAHANGDSFRRRQRERIRAAEAQRKAEAAAQIEQSIKVRNLKRREA